MAHGVMGATNTGINAAAAILGVKRPHDLLAYDEDQELRVYLLIGLMIGQGGCIRKERSKRKEL